MTYCWKRWDWINWRRRVLASRCVKACDRKVPSFFFFFFFPRHREVTLNLTFLILLRLRGRHLTKSWINGEVEPPPLSLLDFWSRWWGGERTVTATPRSPWAGGAFSLSPVRLPVMWNRLTDRDINLSFARYPSPDRLPERCYLPCSVSGPVQLSGHSHHHCRG